MAVKPGTSQIDVETAHQLNVDTVSRCIQFDVNVVLTGLDHPAALDTEKVFLCLISTGLPC
jgi:hypothetical protein